MDLTVSRSRLLRTLLAVLLFIAWENNPLPFPSVFASSGAAVGITSVGRPASSVAPRPSRGGLVTASGLDFPLCYAISLASLMPVAGIVGFAFGRRDQRRTGI